MRILGIDPGTTTTGFGIIDLKKDGSLHAENYGCIQVKPRTPLPDCLDTIKRDLTELIKEYKPKKAAVEEIFFSKNVKTAINVAHARGVIIQTIKERGIPLIECSPQQVKTAVTGYGNAAKSQIQQMVKTIFGLSRAPRPDDAADALAVAIYAAQANITL